MYVQTVTAPPDPSNNGTTETPKITRAEFLRILDRNLKGLNRLRNLEWREAKKVKHKYLNYQILFNYCIVFNN